MIPTWIAHETKKEYICASTNGEVWMKRLDNNLEGERCFVGHLEKTQSYKGVKVHASGDLIWVGSRTELHVYDVSKFLQNPHHCNEVKNIDIDYVSKLRGLGDVFCVRDGKEYLLACGRGIGKAHVWRCIYDIEDEEMHCELLGSMSVKGNTVSVLKFCSNGTHLLTATNNDTVAQLWKITDCEYPFQFKSGQSIRKILISTMDFGNEFHVDENTKTAFRLEHENFDRDPDPVIWLQTQSSSWQVFPIRVLDPSAYEGDVDALAQPHGYGEKLDEHHRNFLYKGMWHHGERHGHGRLMDTRTGKELYNGNWMHGEREGFGIETKGHEKYQGYWKEGHRHGLGKLYVKQVQHIGFFRNGQLHGLLFKIWPHLDPGIPFCVTLSAMEHLGAIRCIQCFRNDTFYEEFGFARVDRQPIQETDKLLFNFEHPTRATFTDPGEKYSLDVCWVCLEPAIDEDPLIVVCANRECPMRCHKTCLGNTAMQSCNWEANVQQCQQKPSSKMHIVRPTPHSTQWFCPMDECQYLREEGHLPQLDSTVASNRQIAPEFQQVSQIQVDEGVLLSSIQQRGSIITYQCLISGIAKVISNQIDFEEAIEENTLHGNQSFTVTLLKPCNGY